MSPTIPHPSDFSTNPADFVARFPDIAAVNLACAAGLPGVIDTEFPGYLKLLDEMAEAVRQRTEKSWRIFKLKPEDFHHSENVFRVFFMEHILRTQFDVKYNPARSNLSPDAPTESTQPWTVDPADIFIHGVLSPRRTGTCSSLPTFSIAVGRRLGYPLFLVRAPEHTFFRWDDGKERFNAQHTPAHTELKDDEFFHSWPRKWDACDHEMNARTKVWLHSMSPRQEVSKFLCNRAIFLIHANRPEEARQAIESAERFDAANPACQELFSLIEQSPFARVPVGNVPVRDASAPDFSENFLA